MALDLKTPYLAIRDLIRADMTTAWSIANGDKYFDPQETEPTSGDLPQLFVGLDTDGEIPTDRSAPFTGFGQAGATIPFLIMGRFAKSLVVSGSIDDAQMAKAQLALNVLTAGNTIYHSAYRYGDPVIRLSKMEINVNENFYTVAIRFPVEVIVDA